MLNDQERELVQQVALAALLHDVGKLAQRAEADPERYRSLANQHLFTRTVDGRVQYHHAAYTWQFIADHAPWLTTVGRGDDDSVAGWAARHHKPSYVCDTVIAEADGLSAGMDRGHPDEVAAKAGWRHVQTCRLEPLLGRVLGGDPARFEVPFAPLDFGSALFPVDAVDRQGAEAARDYRSLFEPLCEATARIPGGDVGVFLRTFLAVYERYAWCVPAATNALPRDVSLFEHSRAAAAIAAALTAELLASGADFSAAVVRRRDEERYLLAVADLTGIQRFLYTIVSKNAARALRGRSFLLQLLSEGIASFLLDAFGLPPVNALYNGGGKIWLLLPRSAADRLHELAADIDLDLQEHFGGRLGFAVGTAPMTGSDFVGGGVAARWEEASVDLQRRRRRRFAAAAAKDYDRIFAPFGAPGQGTLCGTCGKLDADVVDDPDTGRASCPECRDIIQIGRLLPDATCLVAAAGDDWKAQLGNLREHFGGRESSWYTALPPLLRRGFLVSKAPLAEVLADAGPRHVVHVFAPADLQPAVSGAVALFLGSAGGGRAPDFETLAKDAEGIERLGVLRMDVDSLGRIFREGLPQEERTFSRITNLSKLLAYYFSGHVPALLRRGGWENRTQVIYTGGDDLFLVGAWSVLPAVALEIRRAFGRFTAGNPGWGISGGLALIRSGHPIAAAAREAGALEEVAKHLDGKDALAFLDDALRWDDLEVAAALAGELLALCGETVADLPAGAAAEPVGHPLARSWIHRLAQIAAMYRESFDADRRSRPTTSLRETEDRVRRGRWAWSRAYALGRSGARDLRPRLENLMQALPGREWESGGQRRSATRGLIWLLRPAAVWADLASRERRRER